MLVKIYACELFPLMCRNYKNTSFHHSAIGKNTCMCSGIYVSVSGYMCSGISVSVSGCMYSGISVYLYP